MMNLTVSLRKFLQNKVPRQTLVQADFYEWYFPYQDLFLDLHIAASTEPKQSCNNILPIELPWFEKVTFNPFNPHPETPKPLPLISPFMLCVFSPSP